MVVQSSLCCVYSLIYSTQSLLLELRWLVINLITDTHMPTSIYPQALTYVLLTFYIVHGYTVELS